MEQTYLLGADVGTTSLKLSLFGTDGTLAAAAKSSYPTARGRCGCAEQNPDDYLRAFISASAELCDKAPGLMRRVAAFGIVGQSPTDVCLGAELTPVRPAMTWQDTRAASQAEALKVRFSDAERRGFFGMTVPMTGNWTAPRLRWLVENEPESARAVRCIMQPKDYVNLMLTGVCATDLWSARSITNVTDGSAGAELFGYIGLDCGVIAPRRKPQEAAGRVTPAASSLTGIPAGIPVACGTSDGVGAVLGTGTASRPGCCFDSAGTSEIVGMAVEGGADTPALVRIPAHITGGFPVLNGPTQSGASSLAWLLGVLGESDFAAAAASASKIAAGAEGLLFLPYLCGERAPVWDSDARGCFCGVCASHTREHFIRAVLEGVAMSVRHILECAENAAGSPPSVLRLAGGGAFRVWDEIRASVTGVPVEVPQTPEAASLGAAMFAGVAAGMWNNTAQAAIDMVRISHRIEPNAAQREVYNQRFAQYKAAYQYQKAVTAAGEM